MRAEKLLDVAAERGITEQKATHIHGGVVIDDEKKSIRGTKYNWRPSYLAQCADFAVRLFVSRAAYPCPSRGPVPNAPVGHQWMIAQFHSALSLTDTDSLR
jgi:hypothetical protein